MDSGAYFAGLEQWPTLLAAREVAKLAKVAAGGLVVKMEGDLLEAAVSKGLGA